MRNGEKLYDITRPLAPGIAVWPGDLAFATGWSARIGKGSVVNVGTLQLSTHTGTHADAPLHFEADGYAVDEVPLLKYVGPCHVIHHLSNETITPDDVDGLDLRDTPRVLFRTSSSDAPTETWEPVFPALDPDLIAYLGARGVVLIGTDAPSVDPVDSTQLPAHHALARHGIVNLENLYLKEVPPGRYELVALPMRLVGMDAAPVRAILRTIG